MCIRDSLGACPWPPLDSLRINWGQDCSYVQTQFIPQIVCCSFYLMKSFRALRSWEQQPEQDWCFLFLCISSVSIQAPTAPCGAGRTDGNLSHAWPHNCDHIVIVKLSCIHFKLVFIIFCLSRILLPQLCRCCKYVFLMRHMAHSRAAPVIVSSLKMKSFLCW